jgi:chromosome segregation ATPase
MIASNHQGDADFLFAPERGTLNEEAVLALSKAQQLAASRLAIAQSVLEQAHDLEAQLVIERTAIAGFLAAADAAQTGEREAATRVQRSREQLEALVAARADETRKQDELRRAEDAARVELAAAQDRLMLARQALQAAVDANAKYQPEVTSANETEAQMRSELENSTQSLEKFRRARIEANASVEEICKRLELVSGGDLSAEAAIRVVERRAADLLRHKAKFGTR